MSVEILIADDHQILRDGLRALLSKDADFVIVGEASNGQEALRLALELEPDVAVLDRSMPILNGIDVARQIVKESPATRVIVLSANLDEMSVTAALQAGARGLVPKGSAYEELVTAIRAVVAGKQYLSPEISANVMSRVDHSEGSGERANGAYDALTPAERQVLQLIAEGFATKQIAVQLSRSVKTVETHRRNLMEKLQIDSVAGLTRYAVRQGLTTA